MAGKLPTLAQLDLPPFIMPGMLGLGATPMATENERVPLSTGVSQPSTSMGAVFLSYASEDAAAAERIATALRNAGVQVWFDRDELRGGDTWDRQIRQQIHDCRLFIAMVSAHTEARDEGYFRREWRLAVERAGDMAEGKAFLVPVVIDGTSERGAAVPDKFRELQWTRLPDGLTPPAFVDRVRRLLSPELPIAQRASAPAPTGFTTAETSSKSVRPTWRFKYALWAIGVVFAVALLYFLLDRHWLSKRTATVAASAAPPSATAPEKSIAVLPFIDLSEKHDQEYFADGMAEETLNQLAKVPGLKVIGRTSSFQFKGKGEDLRAIGEKLNAAYVLEGSVRKSGEQVRITAQLIETRTGTHAWSETYDRHIADVLKLQDAIAAAVARELQLTVSPEFLQARATLKNTDAYDLMLRGRHAADRWDKEGLDEAVVLFKQAVDLDANSADATAELAFAYESEGEEDYLAPAAAFEQARHAAAAALKLEPKCALAHYVLGLIHLSYDWDWSAAEREFQQVATLAPGSSDALYGKGVLSLAFGRWDNALQQLKAALAQDPVRPTIFYDLGAVQLRLGHLAEAEAAMRTSLNIRPTYDWAHWLLGLVLLAHRDRNAALLEMEQVNLEDGRQSGLAIVYFALGKKAESDAALGRMLKDPAASPYIIANAYAFRGQSDAAMQWLERAYAQRDAGLIYAKVEAPLQSLQEDARFRVLLRKMNLPE